MNIPLSFLYDKYPIVKYDSLNPPKPLRKTGPAGTRKIPAKI